MSAPLEYGRKNEALRMRETAGYTQPFPQSCDSLLISPDSELDDYFFRSTRFRYELELGLAR